MRQGDSWATGGVLLLLVPCLAYAEPIPLEFTNGQCQCVLPAAHGPVVLIVGSLDPHPKTGVVSLRTESTGAEAYLPRLRSVPAKKMATHPAGWRKWPDDKVVVQDPPREKTFFLFSGQGDLEKANSYVGVTADLCARGKHVQLYLDRKDRERADTALTAQDIVVTFDQEIFPWCAKNLGRVLDVDRDGMFTVLLSSRLDNMQRGAIPLDGFVRGSDYFREMPAPFGNRCDMLYLNTRLKPGPQLRTVLVHEYVHAITLSEHFHATPQSMPEEGWLSEGVAHLVEEIHQHGWTNLDYRVTAFLAQTEKYPLVVPDYFSSGLWRTPGTRGSSFLFLRWCQTQAQADLAQRLIQSPLVGVKNIESAMNQDFAELFRGWAVSLMRDESWRIEQALPRKLQRKDAGLPASLWCGPRYVTLNPRGDRQEFVLAGTGLKYFLMRGDPTLGCKLTLHGNAGSELQATLLPLAHDQGFLDASWATDKQARSLHLHLTAHNSQVTLAALSWENVDGKNVAPEIFTGEALSEKLGFTSLRAGETRTLELARPTQSGNWMLHVLGRDAAGRTTPAWAPLPE